MFFKLADLVFTTIDSTFDSNILIYTAELLDQRFPTSRVFINTVFSGNHSFDLKQLIQLN